MADAVMFKVRRLQAFCLVCCESHFVGDDFVNDGHADRKIRYRFDGGTVGWLVSLKEWHRLGKADGRVRAWCPVEERLVLMVPKGYA